MQNLHHISFCVLELQMLSIFVWHHFFVIFCQHALVHYCHFNFLTNDLRCISKPIADFLLLVRKMLTRMLSMIGLDRLQFRWKKKYCRIYFFHCPKVLHYFDNWPLLWLTNFHASCDKEPFSDCLCGLCLAKQNRSV